MVAATGRAHNFMKVTLTATTGVEVVVWLANDTYYARRADDASEPEICLAVDLFEVVAELAELDLDDTDQATEATSLADEARQRTSRPRPVADEDDEAELGAEQCQNGA